MPRNQWAKRKIPCDNDVVIAFYFYLKLVLSDFISRLDLYFSQSRADLVHCNTRIYFYLDLCTILKWDLINNIDHMYISSIGP